MATRYAIISNPVPVLSLRRYRLNSDCTTPSPFSGLHAISGAFDIFHSLMMNEITMLVPALSYPVTPPGSTLEIPIANKHAPTVAIIVGTIISYAKNPPDGPMKPYDANRAHGICANHTNPVPLTEPVSIVRACDDHKAKRDSKRCQKCYDLSHIDLLINNTQFIPAIIVPRRCCVEAQVKLLPGLIWPYGLSEFSAIGCYLFKGEGKIDSSDDEEERDNVIPLYRLVEIVEREKNEYAQRDDLLNYLQLSGSEQVRADSIGRNLKNILEQRDAPAD